jgi:hypothetical protein
MPGRLTRLLRNKIAIAIFGAVLIASAGSAAALAASGNTFHMPFVSQTPSSQQHAHDGSSDDHNGNAQGEDDHDGHGVEGVISSIDSGASSFVVKTEHNSSVTVVVNSATVFSGGLHSFGDLKSGMSIAVDGTPQSDGTLTATKVYGDSEGSEGGSTDDHGGSTSDSATPSADGHDGSGPSGTGTPGSGSHDDSAPHS